MQNLRTTKSIGHHATHYPINTDPLCARPSMESELPVREVRIITPTVDPDYKFLESEYLTSTSLDIHLFSWLLDS